MTDLHDAHADLNSAWQFYKKYESITPKDDDFYHNMAVEADRIQIGTLFGKKVLRAVVSAISEEDWNERCNKT